MNLNFYNKVKEYVISSGFSWEIAEIKQTLSNPCSTEESFFNQYLWVIINAGMKYQVAVQIYHRILYSLYFDLPIESSFKNKQKIEAIKYVRENLSTIYSTYNSTSDKISFLESLPFIGPITKYHLARNLGHDTCKPDRHLLRIASSFKVTPDALCQNISNLSGDPVGVVDVIIWRAANLSYI